MVLSKCVCGSSSEIPENSGLKYDKFIAMGAGSTGFQSSGGTGGTTDCCGVIVVVVAVLPAHFVGVVAVVLLPDLSVSNLLSNISSLSTYSTFFFS